MQELSPEEKKKIYEEEKIRLESQEKANKEIRAKKTKKSCLGCFGIVAVLFFIVLIVGLFNSGDKSDEPRDVPTTVKFVDIGYWKNERARVFSVYTSSTDSKEIEKYAKKKRYTQGGMTMVFFFNDKINTPDVTFVGAEFDKKYEKYCIAVYRKYSNGDEDFEYPFLK